MNKKYLKLNFYDKFQCSHCGKCCKDFYLDIDKEDYERIKNKLKEKFPDKDYHEYFIIGEEITIKSHEDKVCYFRKNNKCFLHQELGKEYKPKGCLSFPFCLVETPKIGYILSSLSCFTLLSLLKDIKEIKVLEEKNVSNFYDYIDKKEEKKEKVKLSPFQTIDWDTFYFFHDKIMQKPFNFYTLLTYLEEFCKKNENKRNISFNDIEDFFKEFNVNESIKGEVKEEHIKKHIDFIIKIINYGLESHYLEVEFPIMNDIFYFMNEVILKEKKIAENYYNFFQKNIYFFYNKRLKEILKMYIKIRLFGSPIFFTKSILEAYKVTVVELAFIIFLFFALINSQKKGKIKPSKLIFYAINNVSSLINQNLMYTDIIGIASKIDKNMLIIDI